MTGKAINPLGIHALIIRLGKVSDTDSAQQQSQKVNKQAQIEKPRKIQVNLSKESRQKQG